MIAKLAFWIGWERRKKRYELLSFSDRRDAIKFNGGHPVPEPGEKAECGAIKQSSRAYRLSHFMKFRGSRTPGRS
jgi:hypothetical protein